MERSELDAITLQQMETLRQLGLVAANVELEDSAIGELKSSLSELSKLDSMQVRPTPPPPSPGYPRAAFAEG